MVCFILAIILGGCGLERDSGTEKKEEILVPTVLPQETYQDISTLPEEIQQILYNDGTFFEVENQKEYTKESYKLPNDEGAEEMVEWGSYIVFDLDEDGEKELIVEMDTNYVEIFIEVFDKQEDKVYAYAFPYRGFTILYTDSAVHGSSGADRDCISTMKFDKNKLEEIIIAESTSEKSEDGQYMKVWYIGDKKVSEEEYYEFISRYHNEEVMVPWSNRPLDEVIKE